MGKSLRNGKVYPHKYQDTYSLQKESNTFILEKWAFSTSVEGSTWPSAVMDKGFCASCFNLVQSLCCVLAKIPQPESNHEEL